MRATTSSARPRFAFLAAAALLLAGCKEQQEAHEPLPRAVRTVTAERSEAGETAKLTGQILAENEAALAFRTGGRMIERSVGVGDAVTPDKVLAKLDPVNEENALRSARAALSAAEGRLVQARNNFDRQNTLLQRGFTTRVLFDQAEQELRTSQSAVDDAQAQLQMAEDRLGFTELRANVTGSVTARLAEAGEVVQPGQTIFQVAREDGRDAVFDVPANLLRSVPANAQIAVNLTDDPSTQAQGRVRTVDPQADPVTRTFRVRVGLIDSPPAMRLGATVTGRVQLEGTSGVKIPASALTKINNQPAVWIVDPKSSTVALRNVEIARFDPGSVLVSEGLDDGDVVVTAGVQALHPGQVVRILGSRS
ncbi:efflux RND transporter periplasmic adaptor subunit [Methylocella silvestris]|uniref:Efflux transporter periplasmic adaptor subunit n=1 Tax=Methylocella silvestris TaxID=199596 RepID=A0A2J7TE33_METSI|nr:efflux RND transporter periplasmic adaptor subunit [Methylocella silvestris]PNG25009.1 efflux transporter periplasmic adaptor subunit [Methylocella silvestris]